jgi:hypothetical protein
MPDGCELRYPHVIFVRAPALCAAT